MTGRLLNSPSRSPFRTPCLRLFKKDEDYLAFERVLAEAHQRIPIRILGWCLMPSRKIHFKLAGAVIC